MVLEEMLQYLQSAEPMRGPFALYRSEVRIPTPFPGMDPYLEHPTLWPGVHNRLIIALADVLSPPMSAW